MATNMMANMKSLNLEISPVVADLAEKEKAQINLIQMAAEDRSVFNVNQGMVWVQVPCAVDSGACANVTPGGIFSLEAATLKLEPKFFGADGSPIDNLGSLMAQGVSEEGVNMQIDFDVAKVTRPLLSVFKMTSNGHKVNFDESGRSILIKGSNKRVKLRQEGRLFMLDLWVLVPAEIADKSSF